MQDVLTKEKRQEIFQARLKDNTDHLKRKQKELYPELTKIVSDNIRSGRLLVFPSMRAEIKNLRVSQILLLSSFLIVIVVAVAAAKLGPVWLLLWIVPFLMHGRANYNGTESNIKIAAFSVTLDEMLELES